MAEELIKISDYNGQKAVSARELHTFLESKRDFSNWIKDRIKRCDLIENQDFEVFNNFGENPNGGRPLTEYALTIETAKEISMVENNSKGKQARRYFIGCEKTLKENQQKKLSGAEYLLQQAQLMVEQERRITTVEQRLDNMDKERKENGERLLEAKLSDERLPEMSMKARVNQLVREYAVATNTSFRDVWHKVYSQLYYLYHISIKSYKKLHKNETNLDIAVRNHFIDKIFTIISNLVRESKAA